MAESFIYRAYRSSGHAEMKSLYDEWADQYDQDLADKSYQTPRRVADMLTRWLPNRSAPILDYGCGTGLSGAALVEAGYTRIDGADLSPRMLALAGQKSLYGQLFQIDIAEPLSFDPRAYRAIVAVGVISVGGAPGAVFDTLVDSLTPGARLVFSMNDQSLKMPDYAGRLAASISAKKVRILAQDYGPHVSNHDENSGSMVYCLDVLD